MNEGQRNNFSLGLVAGILATLLVGLLMGAVHNDGPMLALPATHPEPDRPLPPMSMGGGRYQISAWADGGGYGAFVVDTATGATKMAYSSNRGPGGKSVNNLGKPFQQM